MLTRFTNRVACALACGATLSALGACVDQPTAPGATRPVPSEPARSVSITGTLLPRVVVVFADTASIPQAGLDLVTRLGGTVAHSFPDEGVAFVDGLSAVAIGQLRASSLVSGVAFDRLLNWLPNVRVGGAVAADALAVPHGSPSQARYYVDGTQWNVRVIKADRAWAAGFLGAPTTRVAIVDTGIDYDNRELRGLVDLPASAAFSQLIVEEAGQSVTVPVEPQVPGDAPYMDNHFHGTHVASTIATNNVSVASIAPRVTLVAVKVLNFQGSGSFESVTTGIRHAAGPAHAHVINMSLGAEVDANEDGASALFELMARTIRWAEKQGTIVISAAGNSALDLDQGTVVSTPCEQSTICVSATGPINQQNFDQPASYTNYGITAIDVAAPGGNVPADSSQSGVNADLIIGACSRRTTEPTLAPCRLSTDGVTYFYAYAAGTSMATPHVSALAAQIKSAKPTLSVAGLRAKILGSADDIGVPGRDVYSNFGRIDVLNALTR
jgi:lantibiotic leader peptide-processing serine protease